MYQVIDTYTQGIKGRWISYSTARCHTEALNDAYGERRFAVRITRRPE